MLPDGADRDAFMARYGALYEQSPWVAEGAWEQGPFEDVEQLHAALETTMRRAPAEACSPAWRRRSTRRSTSSTPPTASASASRS